MTQSQASTTTTSADIIPFPHLGRLDSRMATFIYRQATGAQTQLCLALEKATEYTYSIEEVEIIYAWDDYLSKLIRDIESRADFRDILHMSTRINSLPNEYNQLTYLNKALGLDLPSFVNMYNFDVSLLDKYEGGTNYFLEKYTGYRSEVLNP